MNEYGVNLDKITRRSFLIGLFLNILLPMGYCLFAYYAPKSIEIKNPQTPESLENFKIILSFVSVAIIITGFIFKRRLFFRPMIKSTDTFVKDFEKQAVNFAIIVYSFPSAVAIYGLVLALLGAEFIFAPMFAAVAIVFYYFVRPTYGLFEKSLEKQQQFVKEKKFYNRKMFGGPF